jgi:hypothetical protein
MTSSDSSRNCRSKSSGWAKYHDFYQPRGLFNTYFYFDNVGKTCKFSQCIYTSELYQKKYAALRVEVKTKKVKQPEWVELMKELSSMKLLK